MPWTQAEALALCREIEKVAPFANCHVALTGGCLYKAGERKDLDLLFYRIRQAPQIDMPTLFSELRDIGLTIMSGQKWCYKATYDGKPIDLFFPEEQDGDVIGAAARASDYA